MSHFGYEGRDVAHDSRFEHTPASELDASAYTNSHMEQMDPNVAYIHTLEEFKVAAEGHAQNLQNSVLSIKHKTDHVRNELDSVQHLFEGIHAITRAKSRPREEATNNTSSSYSRPRYNQMQSKYMPNTLDNKLEKYKKTAEDRKSQHRSGSTNAGTRGQVDQRSYKLLKDKIHQLENGFNNI